MRTNSRRGATAAVAVVLAAGLLAACGGSGGAESPEVASLDDGTTTTDSSNSDGTDNSEASPEDREQALLDYAECMRDHGIDMPDPQISSEDGGGILIQQEGDGADMNPESEEFQQADEACQPILEEAMGDMEIDPEQQAEMREQLLEFAQCMRDHGIDMEDPVFDENGRVQIKTNGPSDGGGDPRDDEDFQAAQEACNQGGGMFGRGAPDSVPADGDQ
jgi:hypothetical protein